MLSSSNKTCTQNTQPDDPILQSQGNCNSLDKEFIKVLKRAKSYFNNEQADIYCLHLSRLMIERICRLGTIKIKEKTIKTKSNVYKSLKEYSQDIMLDIFIKIAKTKNKVILSKIFDIMFSHLDKHSNCQDNLTILYKMVYFSKPSFNLVKERYIDTIFEIFEKRTLEIMKKFPDLNRKEALNFLVKRSITQPTTFTDNLQDYTNKFFPANEQTSEREEFQTSPQFKTSDEMGIIKPEEANSRNVSFNVGNSKQVKINPQKLPIFNEDGFRIVSRSSRRMMDQAHNKSYNSISNRHAPGTQTVSGDSSIKEKRKNSRFEGNMSYLDDHDSIQLENNGVTEFCKKYKSASDTMRSQARKMGEYFLSIDLGCLLEQKRKQQMDEVAKFSGQEDGELKDIESILYNSRIKTEEKNLKKEGYSSNLLNAAYEKDLLADYHPSIMIGNTDPIDQISHSMIKSSNRKNFDELECLQSSGLKFLEQKTGVRKITKAYAKTCKQLLNILYIVLRDVDYAKLQTLVKNLNMIYQYFGTTVSQKAREQEQLLEAAKFNYWKEGFDYSTSNLAKVAEGIEKNDFENSTFRFEKQRLILKNKLNKHMDSNLGSVIGEANFMGIPGSMYGTSGVASGVNITNSTSQKEYRLFNTDSSQEDIEHSEVFIESKRIIISEDIAAFKIVDLFGHLAEKLQEFVTVTLNDFIVDSVMNECSNPQETNNDGSTNFLSVDLNIIDSRDPSNNPFLSHLRMLSFENKPYKLIKKYSAPVLEKINQKIHLFLCHCPMSNPWFYTLLYEQLNLLEKYLLYSTSRIVVFDVIDLVMANLIAIKAMFTVISDDELKDTVEKINTPSNATQLNSGMHGGLVNHISNKNSPRVSGQKQDFKIKTQKLEREHLKSSFQGLDGSNNNRTVGRSTRGASVNQKNQLSNYSENNIQIKGSITNIHVMTGMKTQFINRHSDVFSTYVRIIAHQIVRIPTIEIGQTFVDIFILDTNFNNLVHIFLSHMLSEILTMCEVQDEQIAQSDFFNRNDDDLDDQEMNNEEGQFDTSIPTFDINEQKIFLSAKYALDYFKAQQLYCKKIIYQEKLYEREPKSSDLKKHWKNIVRDILRRTAKLIDPNKGVQAKFLNGNTVLNTVLAKNIRIETLQKDPKLALNQNLRFNIYYSIFDFLMIAFSFPRTFSFQLSDEIASFYIRYSYLNFVKIYSHLNHYEIMQINKKVMRKLNKSKTHTNLNEHSQSDEPRNKPRKKNSFPILMSKIYLRLLFSIAIDRTEQITNMFYQFRIMEFLYKEVDQEFEISQIRTRFQQIRNSTKQKTVQHSTNEKKVGSLKNMKNNDSKKSFDLVGEGNKLFGTNIVGSKPNTASNNMSLNQGGLGSKPSFPGIGGNNPMGMGFKLNLSNLEKNRSVIEEEPILADKGKSSEGIGGFGLGAANKLNYNNNHQHNHAQKKTLTKSLIPKLDITGNGLAFGSGQNTSDNIIMSAHTFSKTKTQESELEDHLNNEKLCMDFQNEASEGGPEFEGESGLDTNFQKEGLYSCNLKTIESEMKINTINIDDDTYEKDNSERFMTLAYDKTQFLQTLHTDPNDNTYEEAEGLGLERLLPLEPRSQKVHTLGDSYLSTPQKSKKTSITRTHSYGSSKKMVSNITLSIEKQKSQSRRKIKAKTKVPKLSGPMFSKKEEPGFLNMPKKPELPYVPKELDCVPNTGGSRYEETNRTISLRRDCLSQDSNIVPAYSKKPLKNVPRLKIKTIKSPGSGEISKGIVQKQITLDAISQNYNPQRSTGGSKRNNINISKLNLEGLGKNTLSVGKTTPLNIGKAMSYGSDDILISSGKGGGDSSSKARLEDYIEHKSRGSREGKNSLNLLNMELPKPYNNPISQNSNSSINKQQEIKENFKKNIKESIKQGFNQSFNQHFNPGVNGGNGNSGKKKEYIDCFKKDVMNNPNMKDLDFLIEENKDDEVTENFQKEFKDNFVKQSYRGIGHHEPQSQGAKYSNIFKLDLGGPGFYASKGSDIIGNNCTPQSNTSKSKKLKFDDFSMNIFGANKTNDSKNYTFQHILEQSSHKFSNAEAQLSMNNNNSSNIEEFLNENIQYYSERKIRKLYDDDELHMLIQSLMLCQVITPASGILDDLYCTRFPIADGKPNYLHILHYHMNHQSNQHIVPLLMEQLSEIKPYPAGQRLLKLLCSALNDVSIYKDWKKIASGAYGTIFQCGTGLPEPKEVAIKLMSFPESIFDRCVLHDIFSEITCLEYFRLHSSVVNIYDFGVTNNDYFIVMKKYPLSLRAWRLKEEKPIKKYLQLFLKIFMSILQAVKILHANNVTHYDLKCDNILVDIADEVNPIDNLPEVKVTLADFGECKIFLNEDEEFDFKDRGTECVRAPEMLLLNRNARKESDTFDRRQKLGTTRISDVWSLGCLFYELLTGNFLFYNPNFAEFYTRVISDKEPVLTDKNTNELDNNIYIIDFLKYILVRKAPHRPTVDYVLKKCENLCSLQLPSNFEIIPDFSNTERTVDTINTGILINQYFSIENALESQLKIIPKVVIGDYRLTKARVTTDQIALCSRNFFYNNQSKLVARGFTHVVVMKGMASDKHLKRFRNQQLDFKNSCGSRVIFFLTIPKVLDFLREVFLLKGRLIFVEEDNVNAQPKEENCYLREIIIYCLAYFFKCNIFEIYTLVNSQTLPMCSLSTLSNYLTIATKITSQLQNYPIFQCVCGCNSIVISKEAAQSAYTTRCRCSRAKQTNIISECVSDGCTEYIKFQKKRHGIKWDELKWGFFTPDQFIISPIPRRFEYEIREEKIANPSFYKFLLNSEGPIVNSIVYRKKVMNETDLFFKEDDDWKMFACKYCNMWVYAIDSQQKKVAVPLNNLISNKKIGLLNNRTGPRVSVKAPVLRKINLCDYYA